MIRALLLGLITPVAAAAAAAADTSLFGVNMNKSGDGMGVPMQIVLLLTLLTLLPAVVMTITPFLRIAIVLHFLRQALGTQSTPSNQVLLGLSLFLTLLVMQPVARTCTPGLGTDGRRAMTDRSRPSSGHQAAANFLVRFAREKDIRLFLEISHTPAPRNPADLDLAS